MNLAEAKAYGQSLGKVHGKARYDLEILDVDDLRVNGPLGEAAAKGKARLLPGGVYDLAVTVDELDAGAFSNFVSSLGEFPLPGEFSGSFKGEGKLEGKLDEPEYKGSLSSPSFTVGKMGWFKGVRNARVSADGVFGLTSWKADRLSVEADGTAFEASGVADITGLDLAGTMRNFRLGDLGKFTTLDPGVQGLFAGSFRLHGPYDSMLAETSGSAASVAIGDVAVGDYKGSLSRAPGRTDIKGTRTDGGASFYLNVEDDGAFESGLDLTDFAYSALPAGRLPAELTAETVSGSGRLSGKFGGSEATEYKNGSWTGEIKGVTYRGAAYGKVATRAVYPAEGSDSVRIEASIWEGEATVYTLFSPKGKFSPTIGLDLKRLNLSRLAKALPEVKGGELDLKARVTMEKMPPESKDARGLLLEVKFLEAMGSARSLDIKNLPPMPSATFTAEASGGAWKFQGDAPPFRKLKGSLAAADLAWEVSSELDDFDPLEYLPDLKKSLSARISGSARIAGLGAEIKSFSGQGSFSGLTGYDIGPKSGKWRFDSRSDEGKEAAFSLDFGEGLAVSGMWNTLTGSLETHIEADNMALQSWIPKKYEESRIGGKLSGTAGLSYTRENGASGRIGITKLEVSSPQMAFANKGAIEAYLSGGKLTMDPALIAGEGFEARLAGTMKPGANYNLKVDGSLDLGFFAKRIPHVESAGGKAVVSASLTGTWDKPKLEGAIEINREGEIKIDKLLYPFKKISGYAEFELPGELRVEKIDADFGSGKVHVEGRAGLQGLAPKTVEVFVTAKNIHYEYPRGAVYSFDGDYLVAGPMDKIEIRGETKLLSFLHNRQIKWRTATLAMLESARASKVGKKAATSETGTVYVDIAILGDRNIRMENNIAKLDLASDLRVRGYLPNPELWGRLDVKGGTFRFRGREFNVLRSNIEFLGDVDPVAVVDGRAVATVGEYTVNVAANGPIEDIKVELSSVPPLARTDIIALLALGTTTDHLEKSEAVTAFEATNILTGTIQDELEGQAYSMLGIDQFHINPSYSTQRQTTVPRITVGKSLGESLYARYGAEVGSGAEQEVSLEYILRPGVTFLGSWADQGSEQKGSFGAEMRFRFTFR